MTRSFKLPTFVLLLLLFSTHAVAQAVEELDWAGLIPTFDGMDDPYMSLTSKQKRNAYFLWNARKLQNQGNSGESIKRLESKYREKLEATGIDADALIAQMAAFASLREANRNRIKTSLNGRHIRIAGYLLPIEFSGNKIVEFLLVPTVGACIHTPPPPVNQMVHVRLKKGIVNHGLFAPVQVTGLMNTGLSTQSVTYSDGQLAVETGYSMDAVDVDLIDG